jgi:uncharacterized protein YbaR (Trm112 family)
LELEEKLAALRTRRADRARIPDVSEVAGAGPLTEPIKTELQARMFNTAAQQPKKDWTEILTSPALPTIVSAIKGVLGVSDGGSGLGILKELGIDLKTLWERSQAPRADSSLKVGGISLAGAHLTPELWQSIIAYEKAKEDMAYRKEKDQVLADGFQSLVKVLGPLVANKFGGAGDGLSRQPKPPEHGAVRNQAEPPQTVITCTSCGHVTPVPDGIAPGQSIKCGNPECDQNFIAFDEKAEENKAKVRQAQIKQEPELPKEVTCGCGQLLTIPPGKGIGDKLVCPVCRAENTLSSSDIPVMAAEPRL